jgi:hypothetical protein
MAIHRRWHNWRDGLRKMLPNWWGDEDDEFDDDPPPTSGGSAPAGPGNGSAGRVASVRAMSSPDTEGQDQQEVHVYGQALSKPSGGGGGIDRAASIEPVSSPNIDAQGQKEDAQHGHAPHPWIAWGEATTRELACQIAKDVCKDHCGGVSPPMPACHYNTTTVEENGHLVPGFRAWFECRCRPGPIA